MLIGCTSSLTFTRSHAITSLTHTPLRSPLSIAPTICLFLMFAQIHVEEGSLAVVARHSKHTQKDIGSVAVVKDLAALWF